VTSGWEPARLVLSVIVTACSRRTEPRHNAQNSARDKNEYLIVWNGTFLSWDNGVEMEKAF
jgi:hypothetical protein